MSLDPTRTGAAPAPKTPRSPVPPAATKLAPRAILSASAPGQRVVTAHPGRSSPSPGPSSTGTLDRSPPGIQLDPPGPPVDTVGEIGRAIARAPTAAVECLKEVGVDALKRAHEVGTPITVRPGVALGLMLREQLYTPADPKISGDPVKAAKSHELEAAGERVAWLETTGITEIGGGLGGTVPLGYAVPRAGFNVKSLVQYRTLLPCVYAGADSSVTALGRDLVEGAVNLPITPTAAARLPKGGEFEVVGQVTGGATLGAIVGPSAALGPLSVVAGVGPEATAQGNHTRSLKVTNLDGGHLVRVTLSECEALDGEIALTARIGALLNVGGVGWGDGLLAHAADTLPGEAVIATINGELSDIAGASAGISAGVQPTWTNERSFVLDLSKPGALDAFKRLVLLSVSEAEALSKRPESGVHEATLHAHDLTRSLTGSIRAFGWSLFLDKLARTSGDEQITSADGRRLKIHDVKYERDYATCLSGSKHILWEAVTASLQDGHPETYYALDFGSKNRLTGIRTIDQFTGFAHALGVLPSGHVDPSAFRLRCIDKLLTDRADTDFRVNIFFTPEGVARIDSADYDDGVRAYLQAAADLDPSARGNPLLQRVGGDEAKEVLRDYAALQRTGPLSRLMSVGERGALAARYQQLTGRDVARDAAVLADADLFARKIEPFRCHDPGQAERAFADLGKTHGFDFMPTVTALARLAGPAATLVHVLSLQGKSVASSAKDEGSIKRLSVEEVASGVTPTEALIVEPRTALAAHEGVRAE